MTTPRTLPLRALAACVGRLVSVFLLLAVLNWTAELSDNMHARGLLVLMLGLGAAAGLAAGLCAAAAHWALMRVVHRAVSLRAFSLAACVTLPSGLWATLHAGVLVAHRLPGKVALPSLAILAFGLWSWLTLAAARALDAAGGSPRRAGLSRIAAAARLGLPVIAAAALAVYLLAGQEGGLPAASRESASRPGPGLPDIVLVSLDTVRPDHLSGLGYSRPTSPHIDATIAAGTLFSQTISSSSWTVPAHASLMTGASPSRIGLSMVEPAATGRLTLPDEARTLAEALRSHGYRTAGFVGGATLRRSFGFQQGFEHFDDLLPPSVQTVSDYFLLAPQIRLLAGSGRNDFLGALDPILIRICNLLDRQGHGPPLPGYLRHSHHPKRFWSSAREVNAKVEAWLQGQRGLRDPGRDPRFIFVHYFDAHDPYDAPPPHFGRWGNRGDGIGYILTNGLLNGVMGGTRRLTDAEQDTLAGAYDEEIAAMDEGYGDLMSRLGQAGLLDDAIVVLYSDHGESFGDHGDIFHGHSLHEELIRILFSVSWKGKLPAGARIEGQVRAVDIAPTILQLAGLPPGSREGGVSGREGVSLASLLAGGPAPPETGIAFSEVHANGMRDAKVGPFAFEHHSIRMSGWKLSLSSDGGESLYHLASDPGERHNLITGRPDVAGDLRARLVQWRAGGFKGSRRQAQDPDRLEDLKGLGYVDPGPR